MEAQSGAVEEADRGLIWTCGAAFVGEDVIRAGIQMMQNRQAPAGSTDAGASSVQAEQGMLWLEPYIDHLYEGIPAASTPHLTVSTLSNSQSRHSAETKNGQRTLQELLFPEGLLAARLSVGLDSLDDLQSQLVLHLKQNSLETRARYARSILKWFFPDGLGCLVRNVWASYNDESVAADILRMWHATRTTCSSTFTSPESSSRSLGRKGNP